MAVSRGCKAGATCRGNPWEIDLARDRTPGSLSFQICLENRGLGAVDIRHSQVRLRPCSPGLNQENRNQCRIRSLVPPWERVGASRLRGGDQWLSFRAGDREDPSGRGVGDPMKIGCLPPGGHEAEMPAGAGRDSRFPMMIQSYLSFDRRSIIIMTHEITYDSLWIPDWLGYFAQICLLRKPEGRRITYCYC